MLELYFIVLTKMKNGSSLPGMLISACHSFRLEPEEYNK